jgi:hypothetical protein
MDPYHKEWDFIYAVYSAISQDLAKDNIYLEEWAQTSVKHLNILPRDSYMSQLGWKLVRLDDGTHALERDSEVSSRALVSRQSGGLPMNGLDLLMRCMGEGLPVAETNVGAIIKKLSDATSGIISINTTESADTPATTDPTSSGAFRCLVATDPRLAMAALLGVPADDLESDGIGFRVFF